MTTTRLTTSLIATGPQKGMRLRDIFLVSVTSSVLLMGSLGVARADDADDTMTRIKAVEALAPAGSISSDTQKEIDQANQAGKDYLTAKQDLQNKQAAVTTAQQGQAQAQKDQAAAQAAYDAALKAYQPQADAVSKAKADLDATINLYKTSTPQQQLNQAIQTQKTAEQTATTYAKELAAYSKLPDSDPRKQEAIIANKEAQEHMAEAQAAALKAADVAKASNGDAKKIIDAAQARLDAAVKVLDGLSTTKLTAQKTLDNSITATKQAATNIATATTAVKSAQDTVTVKQAVAVTQGVKAFNDANADMTKNGNNQASAPAKPSAPGNVAVVTPPSGAPLVTTGPIASAPVVSNDGGSLIGHDGASLIGHDGASLIGHDGASLIGHDGASLIGHDGASVISHDGGTLLSEHGAGLISEHGAGLISEHGAGLVNNGGPPSGFVMKGSGVSAYSASSQSPDREMNDLTTIRDTKNQLSDAQLKVNAAQTAVNGATSDVTAAQAAVKAAQDKVDALNKTFAGAKSAGEALTAAVKDYNNEKGWLDKASASLAVAKQGQAAFDAAVKRKDPAVSGYTDFNKFKADATAGYANAVDKTNKAQYAAQVAADVVKDPKNGLSPLQKANGELQAAQAALASKQQTATAANTNLASANTRVNQLNTTISQTQADLDAYHQQQQAKVPGQQGNINISGIKGSIDPPSTPSATPGRSEQRDFTVPTDGAGRSTASPTRTVLSVDTPSGKSTASKSTEQAAAPTLPGSSSPAKPTATANAADPSGAGAPVAPAAARPSSQEGTDLKGLSPAALQQLVQVGPQVVAGLQAQQQAALAKGDKTKADALGKDIATVQSQIAYAKTQPAASSAPATPAASAPQVAVVKPSAVSPSPAAASAPSKPAAVQPVQAEVRLTADQGKAVHQALRTIPGNLNKSEQKQFDTLSTLVDKATSKGLTPEETAQLKGGLAALADKHPKAEKQHGLHAIGNSIATAHAPEQKPAIATREGAKPEPGKPVAAPPIVESKATPTTTTPGKNSSIDMVKRPEQKGPEVIGTRDGSVISHDAPKTGDKKPIAPEKPVVGIPEHKPEQAIARTTPTAPVTPPAAEKKDVIPEHHMNIPEHHATPPQPPQPAKQAAAPAAPKPATPPPAAPKPTVAVGGPPKPAAPPAAKPQTCTPNIVGGKMMGMICH